MPELPEVENYRQLLLPLVSTEHRVRLERRTLDRAPPRKFLSDAQIEEINGNGYAVSEVLRKGKLICLVLSAVVGGDKERQKHCHPQPSSRRRYLFVHMGMTGRISTPDHIPKLVEVSDTTTYPPAHTYLRFVVESRRYDDVGDNDPAGIVAEACFSDPRKFGSILLKETIEDDFDVLAPDAWQSLRSLPTSSSSLEGDERDGGADGEMLRQLKHKLANQSMGIKAQLLDQKRIVSGVGNWVADEVLYQCQLHPDQNYLTDGQAHEVLGCLHRILGTAVDCLTTTRAEFPSDWLFHYRWSKGKTAASSTKGKAKKKKKNDDEFGDDVDAIVEVGKDAKGRTLAFVTSGGRTSAIVPTIQKKRSQKPSSPSLSAARSAAISTERKPPRKISTREMGGATPAPVGAAVTSDGTAIVSGMNPVKEEEKMQPALVSGGNARKRKKPTRADRTNGDNDAVPGDGTGKPMAKLGDETPRKVGTRRSARLYTAT